MYVSSTDNSRSVDTWTAAATGSATRASRAVATADAATAALTAVHVAAAATTDSSAATAEAAVTTAPPAAAPTAALAIRYVTARNCYKSLLEWWHCMKVQYSILMSDGHPKPDCHINT